MFTHSPLLIGYAKPVPYNTYNLRGRYDEGLVAFAGPAVNIFLALAFGLAIRFGGVALGEALPAFAAICYINLVLALFNLLPLPPLDGSKVLSALFAVVSAPLSRGYQSFLVNFQRLGQLTTVLLVLVVFWFLLLPIFSVIVGTLFRLLTGITL